MIYPYVRKSISVRNLGWCKRQNQTDESVDQNQRLLDDDVADFQGCLAHLKSLRYLNLLILSDSIVGKPGDVREEQHPEAMVDEVLAKWLRFDPSLPVCVGFRGDDTLVEQAKDQKYERNQGIHERALPLLKT